jgi:hypothetical protein
MMQSWVDFLDGLRVGSNLVPLKMSAQAHLLSHLQFLRVSAWGPYGFAKNERANIDDDEEAALKKLAETLLTMSPASLAKAENADEITEVKCNGEETLENS